MGAQQSNQRLYHDRSSRMKVYHAMLLITLLPCACEKRGRFTAGTATQLNHFHTIRPCAVQKISLAGGQDIIYNT